jgi:FtsZ-binding cell division protein ZapB
MNVKFLELNVDDAMYVIKALTKQKDDLSDEVGPLRDEVLRLRAENEALRRQAQHLKRQVKQYETLRLNS